MGYGMHFPAHQVGGQPELWDIRSYGVSGVWVMRSSTVAIFLIPFRRRNPARLRNPEILQAAHPLRRTELTNEVADRGSCN
jgi:hypothetical protein